MRPDLDNLEPRLTAYIMPSCLCTLESSHQLHDLCIEGALHDRCSLGRKDDLVQQDLAVAALACIRNALQNAEAVNVGPVMQNAVREVGAAACITGTAYVRS